MTTLTTPREAVASDWAQHGVSREIAALWLKHGGSHHGPHTERVSMPMANFADFVAAIVPDSPALTALKLAAVAMSEISYTPLLRRQFQERLDELNMAARAFAKDLNP